MSRQESIKRLLKEESEIPNHIRRRHNQIVKLLDVIIGDSYICDYEDLDHFIEGVFFNMSEYLHNEDIEGLDKYGIMEYVEDNLTERIVEYYEEHIEFCNKNINESNGIPKIVKSMEDSVHKVGVLTTVKLFGKETFLSRLTLLDITRKEKLNLIEEVCQDIGGFSIGELNEEPIFYSENNEEYKEITFIGINHCYVDVWGKLNNTHEGEFKLFYHNLSDDYIDQIFLITLKAGLENNII